VTLDPLLLAILALAIAARLWGIADRLPDPTLGINPIVGNTAVDEGDRRAMDTAWQMWRGGAVPLDLNPRTGDWPGLPFYVALASQVAYRGYDSVTHGAASADEFAHRMEQDPRGMFLTARIFDALLGTLTVFLVFLLGRRLGGRATGLGAAFLLAVNPFHILLSQRVADPNLLALVFVLLATLVLVRDPDADSVASSAVAGAMIGLAAACKYVPMILLVVVLLAAIQRRAGGWRVGWKAIGAAGAAAGLAFFVVSPFTLLDWAHKSQSVALQRGRLLNEWVGLSDSPFSLLTYLRHTFPEMMGWIAYLLAIAGTVLLFRKRPRGWVVAVVPIVLLLPTGSMALAQERFMAPAIGSLVVAAACAIAWIHDRLAARTSAAWAPAVAVLAIAVAWPMPSYVRTREALHRPDTRVLAHRWILESIPPTETMVMDVYGPEFGPRAGDRLFLIWPFLATQAPLVHAAYRTEWLDGIRFFVTSSEVDGRFEAASTRYPQEASFHRWIRVHGATVWSSDSTRASGPRIEVRALPEGISTRAERDAAWDQASSAPMYAPRLARWCSEMATIFLKGDQYDRAEEWASRGLTIREMASRRKLFETLALAQVHADKAPQAEETARLGISEFPDSPLLHVDRAMALEGMGRKQDAIAELGEALKIGSTPQSQELIRGEIARLEEGGR
jgi:hypothetical protein